MINDQSIQNYSFSLNFYNVKCYIFDARTKMSTGGKKQKEGGGGKKDKKNRKTKKGDSCA